MSAKSRKGPVVLVPSDRVALVFDASGWHLSTVPPAWWLDEHERRLEEDRPAG